MRCIVCIYCLLVGGYTIYFSFLPEYHSCTLEGSSNSLCARYCMPVFSLQQQQCCCASELPLFYLFTTPFFFMWATYKSWAHHLFTFQCADISFVGMTGRTIWNPSKMFPADNLTIYTPIDRGNASLQRQKINCCCSISQTFLSTSDFSSLRFKGHILHWVSLLFFCLLCFISADLCVSLKDATTEFQLHRPLVVNQIPPTNAQSDVCVHRGHKQWLHAPAHAPCIWDMHKKLQTMYSASPQNCNIQDVIQHCCKQYIVDLSYRIRSKCIYTYLTYTCIETHILMYTRIDTHMCLYIYMYVCMYVCIQVCICYYIYAYVCMYVCI